jgi:hypothetical protein
MLATSMFCTDVPWTLTLWSDFRKIGRFDRKNSVVQLMASPRAQSQQSLNRIAAAMKAANHPKRAARVC